MHAILRSFITKHTPPIISVIIAIGAATMYLSDVVSTGFVVMKADIITEARAPTYAILLSSLNKQTEKLESDPGDMKSSDIKLLYNQCNSDFGNIYINTLAPSEKIRAKNTCSKLENLYLTRQYY